MNEPRHKPRKPHKQATELIANPLRRKADDPHCPICHPRPDRIGHDRLWRWSREHRAFPLKDGIAV